MKAGDQGIKYVVAMAGFVIMGLGIAFFIRAGLGADPVTVLAQGIALRTGITVGRANQLVSLGLLIAVLVVDRRKLGVGTVINAFMVGWAMDVSLALLGGPAGPATAWAMLILGILLLGLGVGIYVSTGVGQGSVEGAMTILAERLRVSVGLTRIMIDVSSVIAGTMMGATFGPGTIVGAALTGPVAAATIGLMARLGGTR